MLEIKKLRINGKDFDFSKDGRSAYQVAVDNGFKGTEAEWVASLKPSAPLQTTGNSTEAPMSQKAVTEVISELSQAIESLRADVNYKPIEITSLAHNKSNVIALGNSFRDVTVSWKLSKTPKTLNLKYGVANDTLTATVEGSKVISYGSAQTSGTFTYTLIATDEKDATATKSVSFSFGNYIYYGAAQVPASYNSDFVKGLAKNQLLTGYVSTINDDLKDDGTGKIFAFYCLPSRLGTRKFTYGGFTGGFDLVATISVTNSAGYTESYYVYKSSNPAAITDTLTIS